MTLIKESVEFAATPSDEQHQVSVEHAKDAAEHLHAQVVDLSALEGRHTSLAHGGAARDVRLAPAEAMTKGPRDAADTEIAHGASVDLSGSPRLGADLARTGGRLPVAVAGDAVGGERGKLGEERVVDAGEVEADLALHPAAQLG